MHPCIENCMTMAAHASKTPPDTAPMINCKLQLYWHYNEAPLQATNSRPVLQQSSCTKQGAAAELQWQSASRALQASGLQASGCKGSVNQDNACVRVVPVYVLGDTALYTAGLALRCDTVYILITNHGAAANL